MLTLNIPRGEGDFSWTLRCCCFWQGHNCTLILTEGDSAKVEMDGVHRFPYVLKSIGFPTKIHRFPLLNPLLNPTRRLDEPKITIKKEKHNS